MEISSLVEKQEPFSKGITKTQFRQKALERLERNQTV